MRTEQGPVVRLKDYCEADYGVETVDLRFALSPNDTRVFAKLGVVRSKQTKSGTALVFDGDELTLKAIKLDGKTLPREAYSVTSQNLTLHKPPAKKRFTLEIETVIDPEANTKLMGLYRSSGNFCTQCEAEGFRRITFFPDRPDVLAVYTTRIEADAKQAPILLGNGNPVRKGKLANGRHYAVWHDPHPKPSYLFALVAGRLDSIHEDYVTADDRKVKLGIYVEKGKRSRAKYAMDALIRSMRWDEEVFGRNYDLDVFNIVAVSDFNMGAMENKGLNVFNDKYVLADRNTATDADYAGIERVIAHEYFHNWTGNRITCRDWFQLCLKEGLTVFRDQEFCADERSRSVQRIADVHGLKARQFPEDAGPLAHPVRPTSYREINNFYTSTIYEKGAELVRMIAALCGEKRFRAGMDLYFRRHDGEAATIEEFLKCFADAAKLDLTQFALWYEQAGTPQVLASANHDRARKTLTLDIEQNLPATPGQSRKRLMHIPLRIGLIGSDGQDIPADKISGIERDGDLFHLKNRKHKIVFYGIEKRPAISFNRGFTAPVIAELEQSEADLALLARADSDLFTRWQALQQYATRILLKNIATLAKGATPKPEDRFLRILSDTAADEDLEPAYRALMLNLPGEADIAQALDRDVNPDLIYQAVMALNAAAGSALEPRRRSIEEQIPLKKGYSPDANQAGNRSLRNMLLKLGVAAGTKAAKTASLEQFAQASNMNDRFAAFARIVHLQGSPKYSRDAIDAFEARYGKDALVMDKWFAVQATAPGANAAQKVRKLMTHPGFALGNPNRVRSVIGSFAMGNATGFNAASGKGYMLVAQTIGELDRLNPQTAARILTAFRSWRSLEPGRRDLAKAAMEKLSGQKDLSRDSSDILERTLRAE